MVKFQIIIATSGLGTFTSTEKEGTEEEITQIKEIIQYCVKGQANYFNIETPTGEVYFPKEIIVNSVIIFKEVE